MRFDWVISDVLEERKPPLVPDLIRDLEIENQGGFKLADMSENLSSISEDPRFYPLEIKERY